MKIEFQAVALSELSHATITKASAWFDALSTYGGSIAQSAIVVFEFKALVSIPLPSLKTAENTSFLDPTN